MCGARTAQTALETIYTDTQSSATGDVAGLTAIEPAIGQLGARITVTPGADTYTVNVASKKANGRVWTITRTANGNVTRTCTGTGCPAAGDGGTMW